MLHVHTQASAIPEDPKTFSEVSTAVRAGLPRVLSSGEALQNFWGFWPQQDVSELERSSLSPRQWRFPERDCRKLYFSVEMPVLKQPVWQEWHFPTSDSCGNWASEPYPLLNHIWILPTAPELIANNNPFTPQMYISLTESLVITFH